MLPKPPFVAGIESGATPKPKPALLLLMMVPVNRLRLEEFSADPAEAAGGPKAAKDDSPLPGSCPLLIVARCICEGSIGSGTPAIEQESMVTNAGAGGPPWLPDVGCPTGWWWCIWDEGGCWDCCCCWCGSSTTTETTSSLAHRANCC